MIFQNTTLAQEGCTYVGSTATIDVWVSDLDELILQHGEHESQYMCMPVRVARDLDAAHYKIAIALLDNFNETKVA